MLRPVSRVSDPFLLESDLKLRDREQRRDGETLRFEKSHGDQLRERGKSLCTTQNLKLIQESRECFDGRVWMRSVPEADYTVGSRKRRHRGDVMTPTINMADTGHNTNDSNCSSIGLVPHQAI